MRARAAVLLLVAAPLGVGSSGRQVVRLILPGTFFMAPPPIKTSEQWYGAFETDSSWSLRRVTVTAAPVKAICGDSATEIRADSAEQPRFLVTGASEFTDGELVTSFSGRRFLYPGESVSISWDPRVFYGIEALGRAVRETGGNIFLDYSLWFRHRQHFQRFASAARVGLDNPPELRWAGDLDRDNVPDVLFDVPTGDVGGRHLLFLSSRASGDELVAHVATFAFPGC